MPRKYDGNTVIVIAAGCVLAGVLFGALVGGLTCYAVSGKGSATSGTMAKKRITRDEFKAMVAGKTKDDVMRMFGKPSNTTVEFGEERWLYEYIVTDPVNDKLDLFTRVYFDKDGKVIRTGY